MLTAVLFHLPLISLSAHTTTFATDGMSISMQHGHVPLVITITLQRLTRVTFSMLHVTYPALFHTFRSFICHATTSYVSSFAAELFSYAFPYAIPGLALRTALRF